MKSDFSSDFMFEKNLVIPFSKGCHPKQMEEQNTQSNLKPQDSLFQWQSPKRNGRNGRKNTQSNLKSQDSLFQGQSAKTNGRTKDHKAISNLRIPFSKGSQPKQMEEQKATMPSQISGFPFPRVYLLKKNMFYSHLYSIFIDFEL